MANQEMTIPTPAGVSVFLDETGKYPMLTITAPKGWKADRKFVQRCHYVAGEHGADIRFVERA